jgi:hypothetical protein
MEDGVATAPDPEFVDIGPRKVPVWPDGVRLVRFDENAFMAFFPDARELHGPLIEPIVEIDADERRKNPQAKWQGGQKVRGLDRLGVAVFELINARVQALYRRVVRSRTAVVDNCWANVFRDGEYTLPHCHSRATAAVVYALDPGDEQAADRDPMNGVLMFADPRMKACCRDKPLHVSTPAVPPMTMGAMIIFPAHWTHLVTPYWGRRPRISIAWNLNNEPLAGEPKHDGRLQ